MNKWAGVGRLDLASWAGQLFFASWVLKPEVSVLFISIDSASASHRPFAQDSYLASGNFWWNLQYVS